MYKKQIRRRFKETRTVTVSYLKKLRGRKRRTRIFYTYERRYWVIQPVDVFDVIYEKYQALVPLKNYLDEIKERYELTRAEISYPKDFLIWRHVESDFWAWSRNYPPYHGLAYFVKVEIWFVVTRNQGKDDEETFVWSHSRADRLDVGISWEEVQKLVRELQNDTIRSIERKDYLTLQEFIGWSAYPKADWYYKTVRSKRSFARLSPRRHPPKKLR